MSSIVDFPKAGEIGAELKPKRFDINGMYQGDTFQFYLAMDGEGLDVTGWTATSTVKNKDTGQVVANVVTISPVDTVNKRFLISIDSDVLDPEETYKYDVQVVSGAFKRTFIGGEITVTEDITEP